MPQLNFPHVLSDTKNKLSTEPPLSVCSKKGRQLMNDTPADETATYRSRITKPSHTSCVLQLNAAALSSAKHWIHCPIVWGIQLSTPNNLGGTWRRICSLDTRGDSALEALRNRALKIDIYIYITKHIIGSILKQ